MADVPPVPTNIRHEAPSGMEALAATSTHPVIINTDTLTAESDPDDPHSYFITWAAGSQTKTIPILTSGMPYIGFAHLLSTDDAVTQNLIIRCFGYWEQDNQTKKPIEVSTTYWDDWGHATLNPSSGQSGKGIWLPLFNPVTGDHAIEFSDSPEMRKEDTTGSGHVLRAQLQNHRVYTMGCRRVLALVSQACVGPDAAILYAIPHN